MGKFSENLEKAADNAERLASALTGLSSANGDGGSGSSGGGPAAVAVATGFRAPTQAVFNTTVNLKGTSGGGGGGGGSRTGIGPNNGGLSEEMILALWKFGISEKGLSAKRMEEILRMFRELKGNPSFGIAMRAGGS